MHNKCTNTQNNIYSSWRYDSTSVLFCDSHSPILGGNEQLALILSNFMHHI